MRTLLLSCHRKDIRCTSAWKTTSRDARLPCRLKHQCTVAYTKNHGRDRVKTVIKTIPMKQETNIVYKCCMAGDNNV